MDIRPATNMDFVTLFKKPAQTVRAWTIEENGRPLGVGGYYLYQGSAVMFAEILEGGRKCKWPARAMLISARYVLAQALKTGMSVCAVADPTVENSAKLLERIGFVHGYKETYVWAPPHSQ